MLRPLVAALVGWMMLVVSPPVAQARADTIKLEDLPSAHTESLPLGILRSVADDYASQGDAVRCADLRRCDDLHLWGRAVDLDGDGTNEWIVTDAGYSGTGAELDYVFRKEGRRWRRVGKIDGLFLTRVGPARTHGFLELTGDVAGVCVVGRGRARWNGHAYVIRERWTRPRPC